MQATGNASNTIWSPEGKPVSVHLNLDMLAELRPLSPPEQPRAPERGGILLGFTRRMGDKWHIAVQSAVELPARADMGESWRPAPRALDAALHRKWGDGAEVVGFWRNHSRPGLYLDQADFRLFREAFVEESRVALVIGETTGGFFFWEDGDVQRARPYETFALPAAPATAAVARPHSSSLPVWRPHRAWLAVPVAGGILLGFLWNPDPLRRRERSVDIVDRSAVEDAEPRAVFAPPPLPEYDPSQVVAPPPEEGDQERARSEAPAQPARASRRLVPPPLRITAAEPVLDIDTPQMAAVRTVERPIIPHREERLVQTSMETARPSAVRRVVGSIPGFGFLKRRKAPTGENDHYTPPRVVRQVRPNSPGGLPEDIPVRVRVMLDSAGKIEKAELMTRKIDPAVARAAVEAARAWRFEPARMGERPVASELVVQFRFPAAAAGGGGT